MGVILFREWRASEDKEVKKKNNFRYKKKKMGVEGSVDVCRQETGDTVPVQHPVSIPSSFFFLSSFSYKSKSKSNLIQSLNLIQIKN